MLDFLDQVEELAADYGCLPQQVISLPWVQLKELIASAERRRLRQWKFQVSLRNMEVAQSMGLMAGGTSGVAPIPSSTAAGERVLDTSTRSSMTEQRDSSDPEGPGQKQESGDADDFLFWVKMKAQGYPVKLIDRRFTPANKENEPDAVR